MKTLVKVYVSTHKLCIVTEETTNFKETAKLIKDAVFIDDRYNEEYVAKQIRLVDMLKFVEGWASEPWSGHVYCFKEDLDKAKEVLITVINRRSQYRVEQFTKFVQHHNEVVSSIPGLNAYNVLVERTSTHGVANVFG